ncbi:MAG: DNA adenine methyltransferase YhdJ [Verrucomicrobia subdivision 3 bacterium]|nr:DNA adenine methyltransferase YhdJ [Limisphaerales bacterium]MCS1414050.1 DNA adenine methyltransferase YhdJ [Limisphaerales bacterium]
MALNTAFHPNALYYGDCLEVINGGADSADRWPDACVDLIYLDPPFNSKRNYNVFFDKQSDLLRSSRAQARAFEDTWYWDEEAKARVERLRRAAHMPKETIEGLYLIHGNTDAMSYLSYMAERLAALRRILKPTGSLYLHCDPTMSHSLKLLLDGVFGKDNFRNEIVWSYGLGGSSKRMFSKKHDILLFYSKGSRWTFNKPLVPATSNMLKGQMKGAASVWDIPTINNMAKERVGYPTQKPLALLERIIKASSNAGDIVLDPFCGCGTAVAAAQKLGRKWIGIDISSFAVEQVMARRLGRHDQEIKLLGIPEDYAACVKMTQSDPLSRFKFERWAINKIPGMVPNIKQTGDGGIDGEGYLLTEPVEHTRKVIAQVKSGNTTADQIRAFCHVIREQKAAAGVFITLKPISDNRTLKKNKTELGTFRLKGASSDTYPRLQAWSMKEYFDDRRRNLPNLPPLADPFTGKELPQPTLWDTPKTSG